MSALSFWLNMVGHFYRISAKEGEKHKEVEESNFALATPPTFRHQLLLLLLLRGSSLFPAVIFITIIFSPSPPPLLRPPFVVVLRNLGFLSSSSPSRFSPRSPSPPSSRGRRREGAIPSLWTEVKRRGGKEKRTTGEGFDETPKGEPEIDDHPPPLRISRKYVHISCSSNVTPVRTGSW